MMATIEVSERGIVKDSETGTLLGHLPPHLTVTEGLTLLSELRMEISKFEATREILRREGKNTLADMVESAIQPLLAIRPRPDTIKERQAA